MSRFPLSAGLYSAFVLLIASNGFCDQITDLKARAKSATDPASAVDASTALRRAGLFEDARTTVNRSLAKARGNAEIAEIKLELARILIGEKQGKKALRACDPLHKL